MKERNKFVQVIRDLEEMEVPDERLYELEQIRHEYTPDLYIGVMERVRAEEYDDAVEMIEEADDMINGRGDYR